MEAGVLRRHCMLRPRSLCRGVPRLFDTEVTIRGGPSQRGHSQQEGLWQGILSHRCPAKTTGKTKLSRWQALSDSFALVGYLAGDNQW
jgi:hypothetical protein